MANERQRPDPSGFTAENEIDLVLGNANPNPERSGCPSRDVLSALARRERMADDPAYEHLIKCSPCYREVRALQQAAGERRAAPIQSRRSVWATAAAAVLIASVGAWFWWSRPDDVSQTRAPAAVAPAPELNASLDLRKYTVLRSDQQQAEPQPISLPRGKLNLTLLLPVGSEPGEYDVQVLDRDLTSRASTSAAAEIRDFVTTLQVSLDIAALAPGEYQLAIRRHGENWRLFPLEVKSS